MRTIAISLGLLIGVSPVLGQVSSEEAIRRLEERQSVRAAATQPSRAVPTTKPVAAGVALPNVGEEKLAPLSLPLFERILGAAPDRVLANRPLYRVAESKEARDIADSIAKAMNAGLIGASDTSYACDWYSRSAIGAGVVGLELTNGRITRVVALYENFPSQRATQVLAAVKRLDANAYVVGSHVLCTIDGVRVAYQVILIKTPAAKGVVAGARAVVIAEIVPADWYLLYNSPDPEIGKAMRKRKFEIGMTKEQADVTWGRSRKVDQILDGGKRIITKYYESALSDNVIAYTVTFKNGRVDAVIPHDLDEQLQTGTLR